MQHGATLIARPRTPAVTTGRRARALTLPPDLLAKARWRLGFLSALFCVLIAIDLIVAFDLARSSPVILAADGAALLLSALVFLLTRSARVKTHIVLNAGLVFEVILCFIISSMTIKWYYETVGVVPLLDWSTPIILMFPLVVPTPPLKALVASLAAAATPSLAVALMAWKNIITLEPVLFPDRAWHPVLAVAMSPAVAAIIASFTARWVYGLGAEVARARDLGSYRLVSLIGSGGMGEVWRARHRMLARPAAIKLIRPEVLAGVGADSAEQVTRRFEREAQATALLRSPHTIQLYDFGVSDAGVFYYVMELLDGFSCERLVSRFGPLPAGRVIRLLAQVCESLAEAHDAGLIHRDIKPANVFVCRYGLAVDFVKVLDFGLVKPQRETPDDIQLTAEHVAGGTPAFMAPEQVLGNRPVDGRTDLYAVGCLGYWLLTGALAFPGDTPMEIMMHHVHSQPSPPSGRTELAVPEALERLILACLEKDPERRPADAQRLQAELEACETRAAWSIESARHWWDKHAPRADTTAAGAKSVGRS